MKLAQCQFNKEYKLKSQMITTAITVEIMVNTVTYATDIWKAS